MSVSNGVYNLIINADDFGYSSSTNKAILDAFELGFISSTTLLPNGPAFEEACQIAHDKRLVSNVGIHINLTWGNPLTREILKCPRLCDNSGAFINNRNLKKESLFWPILSSIEQSAVYTEIKAQIVKCRKNGFPLTHADSHHHVHTEWPFASIIIKALNQEKIGFLRLSRNVGTGINIYKRVYKRLINSRIKCGGLGVVQYFGSIDDFLSVKLKPNANCIIEIMCHPRYNESILIDLDGVEMGSKLLKLRDALPNALMISYAMLQSPTKQCK